MTLRSGEVFFAEQSDSFIIPESISLFGLSVSFYGILLVLAALVGIIAVTEFTRRLRRNQEWTLTLVTLVILSALLGGRLYYVLFEWQKFAREPLMLLNLRSGGLSYFGALFGAWFAVKGFCRKKDKDFLQSAEVLCFGAAAAAPFVWCGCAFGREPLGKRYDGLFSVRISASYFFDPGDGYVSMHPVAIYGFVLSIFVFIALCFVLRYRKKEGTVFTAYLVMQAAVIIVTECFREDPYCIWGTEIPVNFVVAGVILLTIAVGWIRQLSLDRKLKKIRFIHN